MPPVAPQTRKCSETSYSREGLIPGRSGDSYMGGLTGIKVSNNHVSNIGTLFLMPPAPWLGWLSTLSSGL